MKMTTTPAEHRGNTSKNDILKLVHPGGKVEIFTAQIPAAEVMKLNPRHCVARPDVFKFPWIVVHPESILKPGNVFYIVPNHTIRKLLQKQGYELDNRPADPQLAKSSTSPSRTRSKTTYESDSSVKKHRSGGHSSHSGRQSKVAAYDPSNHDHDRNTRGKSKSSHLADESSGAESDAKLDSKNFLVPCLITDPRRKRRSSCNVSFTLPTGEIIKRSVAQPRGLNHPY